MNSSLDLVLPLPAEAFFVGGLVAACASSALTVAMGAALACQSLLSGGMVSPRPTSGGLDSVDSEGSLRER